MLFFIFSKFKSRFKALLCLHLLLSAMPLLAQDSEEVFTSGTAQTIVATMPSDNSLFVTWDPVSSEVQYVVDVRINSVLAGSYATFTTDLTAVLPYDLALNDEVSIDLRTNGNNSESMGSIINTVCLISLDQKGLCSMYSVTGPMATVEIIYKIGGLYSNTGVSLCNYVNSLNVGLYEKIKVVGDGINRIVTKRQLLNCCNSLTIADLNSCLNSTAYTAKTITNTALAPYPNPFEETLSLHYTQESLPELPSTLQLYNHLGQSVPVFLDKNEQATGMVVQQYQTSHLEAGVYYYQYFVNGQMQSGKLIKLR